MRLRTFAAAAVCLTLLAVGATPASAQAHPRDLGRQTLSAGDGWASAGPGTTGGSPAASADVHVVGTRAELVEALGGDNATNKSNATPKIVYIGGVIDGFESDGGGLLTCADLADPDYS